jgi:hypothetical protein
MSAQVSRRPIEVAPVLDSPVSSALPIPAQADSDRDLIAMWVARSASPGTRRKYRAQAARFLVTICTASTKRGARSSMRWAASPAAGQAGADQARREGRDRGPGPSCWSNRFVGPVRRGQKMLPPAMMKKRTRAISATSVFWDMGSSPPPS